MIMRRLKRSSTECFPPNQLFGSKALARREIFEYIEVYYNNRRLHSALCYQTPRQFEAGYSERRNNFFEEKVSAPFFRMRNVVQESKRNKWRVARREAPFMPACDLECSAAF
jgi:integrase-like protein